MTVMANVKIDIEYCRSCGHQKQFFELAEQIKKEVPVAEVSGTEGRQASFEVRINNELIYSKLQTLAFPDFTAVSELVKEVSKGGPIRKIDKQQPIECVIV